MPTFPIIEDTIFKKVPGIYKIISPKGKIYIGQSWSILKRMKAHKYAINCKKSKLYNSFRKYGIGCHIGSVLQEFPLDISQSILDNYEIFYISQFKEAGINLLNLMPGGGSKKHTKGSKNKMSAAQIGNRNGAGRRGVPHSKETKMIISQKNTGKKHSNEFKEFRKNKWIGNTLTKGIRLSEEHRRKISITNKWKTTSRKITQFDLYGNKIKDWISATEAAETMGFSRSNIKNNLIRLSMTAHKYIWRYKE